MVSFSGPNKNNDGLIPIQGIPVDLGVFPDYVWILSGREGKFYISERSSGMKAGGPFSTKDQAIKSLRVYLNGLSNEQIATMRVTIERQQARNFELAFEAAGRLCPQL